MQFDKGGKKNTQQQTKRCYLPIRLQTNINATLLSQGVNGGGDASASYLTLIQINPVVLGC